MLARFASAFADAQLDVSIAVPASLLAIDCSLDLGGQDSSVHLRGAYTGEISAEMLADAGARFSLVGHSERRQYHGEDDQQVNQKVLNLLQYGVKPLICVGETAAERKAGVTEAVVRAQLLTALSGVPSVADFAVAYEPVWAIGTGQAASPEHAQLVHATIRSTLSERDSAFETAAILYGGSVNADNALGFLSQKDIDGALIGGAALNEENLIAICAIAKEL